MTTWQPIETAPKELPQGGMQKDIEILLRAKTEDGYVTDVFHGWWSHREQRWIRWPHKHHPPTHWLPHPTTLNG